MGAGTPGPTSPSAVRTHREQRGLRQAHMLAPVRTLARHALIRASLTPTALHNRRKPGEIRRILVIRPDHLGDLLFATPALSLVRQSFPDAHITGAVGPWGRHMWEGNPDLDALITIPFPGITGHKEGGALAPYTLIGKVAKRLAREHYDLALILRFDHWWGAALAWGAGIPRRVGYDTPGMGAWLNTAVAYSPGKHEVEQNLKLVHSSLPSLKAEHIQTLKIVREEGRPTLRPPAPTEPTKAATLFSSWLAAPRRAIIHPGTGAANKLWTIAGWAEVAISLQADGWAVALTGPPGERALTDAIVSACATIRPDVGARHASPSQPLNLAGETATLNELTWLLKEAHIVLGVDSGPLHIAAALDTPTIHLYGPSDETTWEPWGDPRRHRSLRAPGTWPTGRLEVASQAMEGGPEMRAITPRMVLAEVGELKRET